jgi:hypothetical protein
MHLRCANCGWTVLDVYEHAEVRRYEDVVESGRTELAARADRLELEAMGEEIERFVQALERDDIVPFDF